MYRKSGIDAIPALVLCTALAIIISGCSLPGCSKKDASFSPATPATTTTPTTTITTQSPEAPQSLIATRLSSTGIYLTWDPPIIAEGVIGYKVSRGTTTISEDMTTTVTSTSYTDTNVATLILYRYTVKAVVGTDIYSPPAATIATTSLLSWETPTQYESGGGNIDGGIDSINIYYRPNSTDAFICDAATTSVFYPVLPSPMTAGTQSNPVQDTINKYIQDKSFSSLPWGTYEFAITAIKGNVESACSNTLSLTYTFPP